MYPIMNDEGKIGEVHVRMGVRYLPQYAPPSFQGEQKKNALQSRIKTMNGIKLVIVGAGAKREGEGRIRLGKVHSFLVSWIPCLWSLSVSQLDVNACMCMCVCM
jgi:hypothetical protein